MNRTQLYTELFSYLSHLVLPFNEAKSELLFSFLSKDLCCRAVFEAGDQEFGSANQIFFYKKFHSNMNQAIVNIIKAE